MNDLKDSNEALKQSNDELKKEQAELQRLLDSLNKEKNDWVESRILSNSIVFISRSPRPKNPMSII